MTNNPQSGWDIRALSGQYTSTSLFNLSASLLALAALAWHTTAHCHADERTLTAEQRERLAQEGELTDANTAKRPARLPDLTKGQSVGEKLQGNSWSLGPTGIVGYMVGGFPGDQIQVEGILAGSPAEGKLQWGDVILGVNGQKFVAGNHLGYVFGKQIIESERPKNQGVLKLQVWRDRNFLKRNARKDVVQVDIEKLFNEARKDDSLYEWKPEAARTREVSSQDYEKFPLDGFVAEVELKLRVLPEYSDTSPYNCPKTDQILEDAWNALERRFVVDPNVPRSGRGGVLEAIALVASGQPEHRKIVHEWVRSKHSPWRPPTEPIGARFDPAYKGYNGYQSWHHGFNGLNCAIYYDATGDDFVVPALKKYSIEAAMGQAGGGSWGHTFAFPKFNGGKLHGMNPGYGALNCAGNRCFFLVALAQKLGIKHPEIDLATERAQRFFGSFADKGAIPYGYHGAAYTDDSNGKNSGVAFALKLLGDHERARYFAQMCTHASFTRRGGHGHDYHGNWSGWAATLCGPEGTIITERNMRWRRTLCRRHDGAFVYHSPTGDYGTLRDPTATAVLHYAAHLKQTLITGKDVDESYAWNPREMEQLLTNAIPQLNDAVLLERAGKPWRERSTDEIFALLDFFKPKARNLYTQELGKRYKAGEQEILPRLAALLENDDPRLRDSGCRGLAACGRDASLQYLSKVARLLNDPKEFVRMQAERTMTLASDSPETQVSLLKATTTEYKDEGTSPNNFPAWVQNPLFGVKGLALADSPFEAGHDEELVQAALEKLLELDPIGNRGFLRTRAAVWSKDTVVRLAGPITFVAEEEQTNDQMFSGRNRVGQAILARHGYGELIEASSNYLRKKVEIPRAIRPRVGFKRELVDVDVIKQDPGACHDLLDPLKIVLADNPLATITQKKGETKIVTRIQDLVTMIEQAKKPAGSLPSLSQDVEKFFAARLAKANGTSEELKLCRAELKVLARRNYFRKMAAMNHLVAVLGPDAIDDLIPYLGHNYWRLRLHVHDLVVKLKGQAVDRALITSLETSSAATTAAILTVLADRGTASSLESVRNNLTHSNDIVRAAAVQAIVELGGEQELKQAFTVLRDARSVKELEACELAILYLSDKPQTAQQIRKVVLWALPQWKAPVRHSLYWLLAQMGGEENLATLKEQLDGADDGEFREIACALSWSPDDRASSLLLSIIKENLDTPRAQLAAQEAVRRMVVGSSGLANLSIKQRLDFADRLLSMVRIEPMVTYLGCIHTGRCAQILQRVMRQGGVTNAAAESIISATTGMEKSPAADRKLAAAALVDAIEFIEVTYVRGGVAAAVNKRKEEQAAYIRWKAISAQAGKNLLKLDKPEDAPIPEFNDLDLDF